MKKFLSISIATFGLLATPLAQAWTYNNRDVLLIFRETGFNDIEFNLGNVGQFSGLAAGTSITVSNWDQTLLTDTFGPDLSGASVILAATTSQTDPNRAAWLTSRDTSATVNNLTPSAWQAKLWSIINAIGTKPVLNQLPAASTNGYSIDPNGTTRTASYDYIVTGGGVNLASIAELGGNAAFTVEGVIPTSFGFWQVTPSTASPLPQAIYVGTFTIDANGRLTFKAGPLVVATPPTIVGVTRQDGISTVTFSTTAGGNYSLAYTSRLGGDVSTWPIVTGPIAGNGSNVSLTHTNNGASGFYSILRTQ